MVSDSSPAANIFDILLLIDWIFEHKFFGKTT